MIEDLFNEIAARGWLVDNLFQVEDGSWKCTLRVKPKFEDSRKFLTTSIAYGVSLTDVLTLAIDNITTAKEPPTMEILSSMGKTDIDLRAQLSHLIKPKLKGLARRV
jgi:hypothetical protein